MKNKQTTFGAAAIKELGKDIHIRLDQRGEVVGIPDFDDCADCDGMIVGGRKFKRVRTVRRMMTIHIYREVKKSAKATKHKIAES